MDYSEYHEKELIILQRKMKLQEEYQHAMDKANQELSALTDSYLGDFATGRAVKFKGEKYFIQENHQSISDRKTAVTIRKARKDGLPSVNGAIHYYIETCELELWDEFARENHPPSIMRRLAGYDVED